LAIFTSSKGIFSLTTFSFAAVFRELLEDVAFVFRKRLRTLPKIFFLLSFFFFLVLPSSLVESSVVSVLLLVGDVATLLVRRLGVVNSSDIGDGIFAATLLVRRLGVVNSSGIGDGFFAIDSFDTNLFFDP
jgi:hypothetical protein